RPQEGTMGRKSALKRERKLWRNRREAFGPAERSGSSEYWAPADDKISTRLDRVAKPLLDDLPADAGIEEKGVAYQLAAIAWNLDVTDEEGSTVTAEISDSLGAEGRGLVEALRERKRTLFPDDRRMIVDMSVRCDEG